MLNLFLMNNQITYFNQGIAANIIDINHKL